MSTARFEMRVYEGGSAYLTTHLEPGPYVWVMTGDEGPDDSAGASLTFAEAEAFGNAILRAVKEGRRRADEVS